jgi:phage RecT family recombinase
MQQLIPITDYGKALESKSLQDKFEKNLQDSSVVLNFQRECTFAIQAIKDNPGLQKCSPATVADSIKKVSLTGLSLNPLLGHAYMIPRRTGGVMKACLDIGYQGWILIAHESGFVNDVFAQIVYENEVNNGGFTVELGSTNKITHTPYYMLGLDEATRGRKFGVYATVVLSNGTTKSEFMTAARVHAVRDRSQGYQAAKKYNKNTIWEGPDEERMWQKTAILNVLKYVPSKNLSQRERTALELYNEDVDLVGEQARGTASKRATSAVQDLENEVQPETVDVSHEEIKEPVERGCQEYKNLLKKKVSELQSELGQKIDYKKVPDSKSKTVLADLLYAINHDTLQEYLTTVFPGIEGDLTKMVRLEPTGEVDSRLLDYPEYNGEPRKLAQYKGLFVLLEGLRVGDNFRANMQGAELKWNSLDHLCKEGTLMEITEVINLYGV